jgi:hypothetical protein
MKRSVHTMKHVKPITNIAWHLWDTAAVATPVLQFVVRSMQMAVDALPSFYSLRYGVADIPQLLI